jgi:hypothetical protein
MTGRREAIVIAGAMLAATAWVIAASASLGPVARRMPLVVALSTLLLLVLELVREVRLEAVSGGAASTSAEASATAEVQRISRGHSSERVMFSWIGVLLALIVLVGMRAGVPLFLLAYMRVHFRESWRASLLLSGCIAILLTAGLEYLLGLPLHPGAITGWLGAAR